MRVTIIDTESALGAALAAEYATAGHDVRSVAWSDDATPEAVAAALGNLPIDRLVFCDAIDPPDRTAEAVGRAELGAALARLTALPFRLAALLRGPLAAGTEPRLVLVSRRSATMETEDGSGRYLERPFRAAAHALWRCLSVEWGPAGIACRIVALDDPDDRAAVAALPTVIEAASVDLVDGTGAPLGW